MIKKILAWAIILAAAGVVLGLIVYALTTFYGRIEWRSVAKVITDTDGRGRPPRNKQEEDDGE